MNQPPPEINISPANITEQYQESLNKIIKNDVLSRLRLHDHTLWSDSPDEITNRLDWLELPQSMLSNLDGIATEVNSLRNDDFSTAILLGMGGSSLAPEVFTRTFGKADGFLDLQILDTTNPVAIRNIQANLDLSRTVFIVATKSGGTVETLSLFKHFYTLYNQVSAGQHFIAITDPGSKLLTLAEDLSFRKIFLNNPNLGGRYSALSHFGLVPAALLGTNLGRLLRQAGTAAADEATAAQISALLGAGALAGRDKLTLITDKTLHSFSDWIEQLIAESTGKHGKGIVPIVGETLATDLNLYGNDRLFVVQYLGENLELSTLASSLASLGHPVLEISIPDVIGLGFLIMTWEMATAIAGHLMGIQPFDQPDVESAKVLARNSIQAFKDSGALPMMDTKPINSEAFMEFLEHASQGDYISLQAYLPSSAETTKAFREVQRALRDKTRLAVTFGYGPRFLHSTGQLHKGDRGNGWFVRFISSEDDDLPIPDRAGSKKTSITFNALITSQAIGDGLALAEANRPVITFKISAPYPESLWPILSEIES